MQLSGNSCKFFLKEILEKGREKIVYLNNFRYIRVCVCVWTGK